MLGATATIDIANKFGCVAPFGLEIATSMFRAATSDRYAIPWYSNRTCSTFDDLLRNTGWFVLREPSTNVFFSQGYRGPRRCAPI